MAKTGTYNLHCLAPHSTDLCSFYAHSYTLYHCTEYYDCFPNPNDTFPWLHTFLNIFMATITYHILSPFLRELHRSSWLSHSIRSLFEPKRTWKNKHQQGRGSNVCVILPKCLLTSILVVNFLVIWFIFIKFVRKSCWQANKKYFYLIYDCF